MYETVCNCDHLDGIVYALRFSNFVTFSVMSESGRLYESLLRRKLIETFLKTVLIESFFSEK